MTGRRADTPITWIALLRGVNVGGGTKLAMKALVPLLQGIGLDHVRTYLQSGNVVFRSRRREPGPLAEEIRQALLDGAGFGPPVLLLRVAQLEEAVRGNPYPEAEPEPRSVHVFFLWSRPEAPDLEGLERLRGPKERFLLRDRLLYLHAPDGIGRSRLAAAAPKHLGVPATARNWRSVTSILDLARGLGET